MRAGAICILIGLSFVAGCAGNASPSADPMLSGHIGENCIVHFRHDALGMAAAGPAPPRSGNHNGADTEVSGKLLRVNAVWICIGIDKAEFTIPKEAILWVSMSSK
jgi:hypothetical protein